MWTPLWSCSCLDMNILHFFLKYSFPLFFFSVRKIQTEVLNIKKWMQGLVFIYHVSFIYHVLGHLIIYNDYPLNDIWKIVLALNHTKVMEDVSFTFPSIRIYTFGRFPSVFVSSSSLIQYWVEQQERSWRDRNEAGRGRNEEAWVNTRNLRLIGN